MLSPPAIRASQYSSADTATKRRDDALAARRDGRKRRSHRAARQNFNLYFLTPIMIIVGSAMIALVGGTYWLTSLQNTAERSEERDRVRAAFISRVEALESTVKVFGVWDDAAINLVNKFDPAWADVNEGLFMYNQHGPEMVFVVDQAGRSVYGHVDGKRTSADPSRTIGRGFASALDHLIRVEPRSNRIIGNVSLTPRGPVIFILLRIRPHSDRVAMPAGVQRYLVMAKRVDAKMLRELWQTSDTAPLTLGDRPREGMLDWTFAPFDGAGSKSLLWRPHESGTDLWYDAMPWLALLIGLISILAGVVLRRARKAAQELVASETKALYLASRDALTGLPNRRSFGIHLLELQRRSEDYALLFLDLDGFKHVNDTFGHAVGDKLLCRTAERLQRVIPAGAFVARLGGDEFAITVPRELVEREGLATRLIAAVGEPHHFGGEPTTVGVSIGIATGGARNRDDAVRQADTAMYAAKQAGRNRALHYTPCLEEGRAERRRLEADLKQALANGDIFVLFQPIVDAQTGRTITVEALARWTHPTLGPISPDVFVPIAEESGLIVELGRQILDQACAAARDWPFRLAVNLSPAQFWEGNLVDEVMATLARFDFPPARLKFEITETYLLSRPDAADKVIRDLRRHGIRIALDDFGTGYASIGYLRRFQFDLVKIDRSLVEAVAFDAAAADVLLAIVSLCKALDLPILAEGVETEEQAVMLRRTGCKYLQGWHFGRPMRAEKVDAIVGAMRRRVA